jgi:hypothetical protein
MLRNDAEWSEEIEEWPQGESRCILNMQKMKEGRDRREMNDEKLDEEICLRAPVVHRTQW